MKKAEWTKQKLTTLAKNANSKSEILRALGLSVKNGNYKTLYKYANMWSIDLSHIKGQSYSAYSTNLRKKIPTKKIMVKNSTYSSTSLKARIIKEKIINYACSICGNTGEWMSKNLVLVLDHINGINNDHRKENLRFLCPNCNAQTKTFCIGNINKKKYINPKTICHCGERKDKRAKSCMKCFRKSNRKIPNRPSEKQLLEDLENMSYVKVGKKYGVSDNCIRKWLKGYSK